MAHNLLAQKQNLGILRIGEGYNLAPGKVERWLGPVHSSSNS
jgi:hypothetical protein